MAGNVHAISGANFDAEVLKNQQPVLVDFWASWCGPCRMVAPVVEELAVEYEGKLKVVKVNIDEEMSIARDYRVVSIPTLMMFKDGRLVDKTVGALPKDDLADMIEKYI